LIELIDTPARTHNSLSSSLPIRIGTSLDHQSIWAYALPNPVTAGAINCGGAEQSRWPPACANSKSAKIQLTAQQSSFFAVSMIRLWFKSPPQPTGVADQ